MTVYKKTKIHVVAEQDRVLLMIGQVVVKMPYATAFTIAQGMRLGSKNAMRYAKEEVSNWVGYATDENLPEHTSPYKLSKEKRVNVHGTFGWAVGWEGENVKCMFGNNELKFHFTTALQIMTWLRHEGKVAKGWSGDGGRSKIMASTLSNAEENYRLGVK